MKHEITLLSRKFETHDVQRFVFTRPDGFEFEPGQGVEVAIDEPAWRDEKRPFTPVSLRADRALEFLIKRYPQHDAVTERLHELAPGARLGMSEAFGTIRYRGPGVFLAGGAGMTPFLAILRDLAASGALDDGHQLLFSNKTPADVFCERELLHLLGDRCLFLTTNERGHGSVHGRIDRELIARRVDGFDRRFYVCGPPAFVDDLKAILVELGADADSLVFEE